MIYKRRKDLEYNDDDFELLWVEVDKCSTKTQSNVIIGTVYRCPGSDPNTFLQKLNETLNKIDKEKKSYSLRRL